MITFCTGDLFKSDAEALVNAVNTDGIMGGGIALQFKIRYPEMYQEYKKLCDEQQLYTGMLYVWPTGSTDGVKYIINFPTKANCANASRLEYIEVGLDALVYTIQDEDIKSIAVPALGCGLGGLDWSEVRPLMERKLEPLKDVNIMIYIPYQLHP
ncbi:MAG: macro domain-containing protein [Planctomycetia bacterium]|nr:macro domain-containing protein [Planctomycetia bacterium]